MCQAEIAWRIGDLDTVEQMVVELTEVADKANQPAWRALAWRWRGGVASKRGDNAAGAECYEKSLDIWKKIEAEDSWVLTMFLKIKALEAQGKFQDVIEAIELLSPYCHMLTPEEQGEVKQILDRARGCSSQSEGQCKT